MGRECWDCYYSEPDCGKVGRWRCKKKHISFPGDQPACSSFVHEDVKSCLYCYYYQSDDSFFAKIDDAYCKKHKKKIKTDTLACSYFIED